MDDFDDVGYVTLAKGGLLLGVGLFVLGAGGELVGHALYDSLPGWENTLFLYSEGLGLVIGFFSPILFGIVMPLVE
ncbi:hypothetical protein BRD00_13880 [Halobacteriales archaeon QS_8_69_26]|nr:MAG: hypothetical protein BRD00_13880 [Halobacteriales archaeon QS_8_69_26]